MQRVGQAEGEPYNLKEDPREWKNLYRDERYATVREQMESCLTDVCGLAAALSIVGRHRLPTRL